MFSDANPIPIPFSDVYSALEQHQVDGFENTPSNIYSKKFYQLQRYITVSNHGYLGYAVLFNNQVWQTLPNNIQRILLSTLDEVTKWERREAFLQNQTDLRNIKKERQIKVYELNSKETQGWKDKLNPIGKE